MTAPAHGHDAEVARQRPDRGGPASRDLREHLLQRLERQIDLPAWLIAQGFHLSPVQRDLTRLAFASPHAEALYLWKDTETRTWSYETADDPPQRGTIVDLLCRDGMTPEGCIDRLANCLDPSKRTAEPTKYREALADHDNILGRAVARHVQAVTAERAAERDLESLGVPSGTFDRWRFGSAATVLQDLSHIGHSRYRPSDREIVVLERRIDAIAYERVHGKQHATYIYVGDNPTDETKRKLAHVIADAPANLTVVAALGKDRRGTALAQEIAEMAGRRPVQRRSPEFGGRWADQMQIEARHRASLARLHQQPDPVIEKVCRGLAKALDAGVDVAHLRTAIIRRPSKGLDR
jgi:hypothetical protein